MSAHHPPSTGIDHPTVILGGGIAGLAAATSLARQGVAVTLLQAESDHQPEPASVPLLHAYTSLLALLDQLGHGGHVAWQRVLPVALPAEDGRSALHALEPDDLPAPMHLVRPIWRCHAWTVGERYAIARGLLAILQVSHRSRGLYDGITFAQYLADQCQPRRVVTTFWSALAAPTGHASLDSLSASAGIQLIQEGYLFGHDTCALGTSDVTVAALMKSATKDITAAGGRVVSVTSIQAIVFNGTKITGIRLTDGQEIVGASYLCAVPADTLARLAPENLKAADPRLAGVAAGGIAGGISGGISGGGVDAMDAGRVGNLYLAGTWVGPDFPGTIEAAARTGFSAASAILHAAGSADADVTVPPLEAGELYRFVAG